MRNSYKVFFFNCINFRKFCGKLNLVSYLDHVKEKNQVRFLVIFFTLLEINYSFTEFPEVDTVEEKYFPNKKFSFFFFFLNSQLMAVFHLNDKNKLLFIDNAFFITS